MSLTTTVTTEQKWITYNDNTVTIKSHLKGGARAQKIFAIKSASSCNRDKSKGSRGGF